MGRIKIIFFDIDGTLIDMRKKHISEKTLETLARLKRNGILLCLATGRSPLELPHFGEVEFDAFLTYNGSYCYRHNAPIFKNPLLTADVKTITENAKQINRPVSVATSEGIYANGTDEDLAEYLSIGNMEVNVSAGFDDIVSKYEIYQVMLGCREKDYSELMKNVRCAKITAWWDRAVDIIPASGGKDIGVGQVLKCFGLDRTEALAFGDGNNDIEMLQSVGCGIAMGNASPKLKMVADDICGCADTDGIYYYCLKQGLI